MRTILFLLMLLLARPLFAETLSFGIVPQQSATKLAAVWTPVLNYLSQKSGIELQFATAKDIPTFEKRLYAGEYDIAYMNPYHFVFFNKHQGYSAMVNQADKRIQGLILVRKDSPIQSLEELNGQQLAFPSPAAFAASVLPRGELAKLGIDIDPVYVSSHDSVYLNVAKGFFVAGGGIARTFNSTSAEARDALRVLWKTQEYTPHAIAAHPRVSLASRQKLTAALVAMGEDPQGAELLKALAISAFQTRVDADWDDVRDLNIRLLDGLVE